MISLNILHWQLLENLNSLCCELFFIIMLFICSLLCQDFCPCGRAVFHDKFVAVAQPVFLVCQDSCEHSPCQQCHCATSVCFFAYDDCGVPGEIVQIFTQIHLKLSTLQLYCNIFWIYHLRKEFLFPLIKPNKILLFFIGLMENPESMWHLWRFWCSDYGWYD